MPGVPELLAASAKKWYYEFVIGTTSVAALGAEALERLGRRTEACDLATAGLRDYRKALVRVELLRGLGRCAAEAAAVAAPRDVRPRTEEARQALEEAVDVAQRNRFPLLELLALGELQRLVLAPEGKEAEGMARLEASARSMGGQPLSAFASVRNW